MFKNMRIFVFMGLPYQGKTTASHLLLTALKSHPDYKNREIKYISTDVCRAKTLREDFPHQHEFLYTKQEETLAWQRFLGEITTFLALSPVNSVLVLDGTFTAWSKLCELLDILTLNIDSFASQRLPLIVDFVHIGSQFGERVWKPSDDKLNSNKKVLRAWFSRCSYNEALGIAARVPDDVFNAKVEELKMTLNTMIPMLRKFMKDYYGLIYFARHFLKHHPNISEINKII